MNDINDKIKPYLGTARWKVSFIDISFNFLSTKQRTKGTWWNILVEEYSSILLDVVLSVARARQVTDAHSWLDYLFSIVYRSPIIDGSILVARNFNKVIIMDCWRECCFVKISDSIHPEEPSLRHCSSPRQISALMLYLLRMNKSLYVKNVNFRPLHLDVNDRKKEKSKAFGPHFTRRLETCCWLPSRPFGMRAWPSLVSSETWWYFLPFLWIASCIWSVTLSWPAWRSVIFYAQS